MVPELLVDECFRLRCLTPTDDDESVVLLLQLRWKELELEDEDDEDDELVELERELERLRLVRTRRRTLVEWADLDELLDRCRLLLDRLMLWTRKIAFENAFSNATTFCVPFGSLFARLIAACRLSKIFPARSFCCSGAS